MDFNDTFLSYEHVVDSFPNYEIKCDVPDDKRNPPFRLVFEDVQESKENDDDSSELQTLPKTISVQSYDIQNRGPYLENKPKQ